MIDECLVTLCVESLARHYLSLSLCHSPFTRSPNYFSLPRAHHPSLAARRIADSHSLAAADLFLTFNGDGFQSMDHTIRSTTPIFVELVNLPFGMRGRPEFMLMPLIMPGALSAKLRR